LCEVQGYVYAAKMAAARLAELLGEAERGRQLQQEAETLRARFDAAFWCPELSLYALALDGNKKPCRVRASNVGHCLYTGIAMPDKAPLVARALLDPDFFTGWGIRTVSRGEARYNPLSYHNGSVWPHDNSIVAAGLARYGFKKLAGRLLLGLLDASSAVELHRLPELFCGLDRRVGEGPTLYPVACSPQAWAAGAIFLLLGSCLGISVDERGLAVSFDRPCLPEGLPQLWIKNLRVGPASVDLLLDRQQDTVGVQVTSKTGDLKVLVNL
jgi:glycogen debranching enzyme